MKKIFLLLSLVVIITANVRAEENVSAEIDGSQKIKREMEKYVQDCSKKVYPKNLDEINMYNDDFKKLDAEYHQCLKSVIISKINELATKEDADKMIQSLNKIQDGILDFYWTLYNREDNGVIGRGINDAAMGRYYEQILEDIILYEQNLQYY